LTAIFNLSGTLSPAVRTELFWDVFALTDRDLKLSEHDEWSRATLHPLSRFRLNFGVGELRRCAIRTACRLAAEEQHVVAIEPTLYELLQSADEREIFIATQSLMSIDQPLRPYVDPSQLASHRVPQARLAAVWLWAAEPAPSNYLGHKLAGDPSVLVRRAVAAHIHAFADKNPELYTQLRERLMADQSASVRLAAEFPEF